jgi:hypothetical protein
VGAPGVVGDGEGAEQCLQVAEGGRLAGLGAEPVLHCLLEPLDLPPVPRTPGVWGHSAGGVPSW